jgi:hypothetical protein
MQINPILASVKHYNPRNRRSNTPRAPGTRLPREAEEERGIGIGVGIAISTTTGPSFWQFASWKYHRQYQDK